MADTENNLAIILITRTRLEIFDLSQKKVFPFNLSPNMFTDLEIINKNELETQLFLFINFYKIRPVPVIIILSSEVCFELEIPDSGESAVEAKINKFINFLPFEESIHKIYKLARGFYISAVNREIIETFRYIFKKAGFYTEAVVPASIVGINIKTIDAPSADFILAKLNVIKSQSLVSTETRTGHHQTVEKKVLGINRVFILLSVFLLLLIVLLFVLYQQSAANKTSLSSAYYLTRFLVFSSVNLRG